MRIQMIWAVWEPPQPLLLAPEANWTGAVGAGTRMKVPWPWRDRPPSLGVISSCW